MNISLLRRLLPAALAASVLGGCTFGQQPAPTPIPLLVSTPGAESARPVYTVSRGPVIDEMHFPAEVNLATREDLFFASAGRIQEVYVQSGDTVKLDEVIAVLDTRQLQLDLQAAEETLGLAQQRLAAAETDLRFETEQRRIDLQTAKLRLDAIQGSTAAATLNRTLQELAVRQAELALEQLEGGVDPVLASDVRQAEIALQKVKTDLADAQISAPFAGQVLLYDALEKGKVVQAYSPVAAIVDPQALVIEANLLPADLQSLYEGMPVTIRIDTPLPKEIAGVIRTLPQPFGTGTGSSAIILPKDASAASGLRSGAGVEISAHRSEAAEALWLPPDAIQGYKDNYYVRLADGGEQPVTVGIFAEDRVEIASGLKLGDEVVGP